MDEKNADRDQGNTVESTCHISSVIRHFFPSQNNSKNLDPSFKMDLDLWDCLGRIKIIL